MKAGVLGDQKQGRVFVLSGPAGTGKNTLMNQLIQEFPSVEESISYTTREARHYEETGHHYHFITNEEFEEKIKADEFLEYVKLYDDYYGTSRKLLEERLALGKNIFLVIDTQGALQIKERFPATFIFIAPPSVDALRERLAKRKTETEEMLEKRLVWAEEEMTKIDAYDYKLINDDVEEAYEILRSILIAESHRIY